MKKIIFLFFLCSYILNVFAQTETKEFNCSVVYTITEENSKLDNEITLPIGTTWSYTSSAENAVKFTLPKGYRFIKFNETTNVARVAEEDGGGYSCTCGGTGSCTVFYQSKLGYGCLQSTCSGTCTGQGTSSKIIGIINSDNDQLSIDKNIGKASLSIEGMANFLKLTEVQHEIKKNYDFVYANMKKPDFNSINSFKDIPSEYFMANFYIFGVEVGLILPKDESIMKLMPELNVESAPTSCSCSGSNLTNKAIIAAGCKLEKECIFGYCAYYCTGCTTCTMR